MSKPLEELTDRELWRLFPVILAEHDPSWKDLYDSESELLVKTLGGDNVHRISHIGSTAVPGLIAKPTIDILLEVPEATDPVALIASMESAGYIYSPQPSKPAPHMMFMKGYTPEGFRGQAYHVHVRYPGDWDEPVFRDYLISHPAVAAEYGELKKCLLLQFRHDRDAYTEAKGGFIRNIVSSARNK